MNITIEEIISIVSLQLGIRNIHAKQRLVEDLSAESADIANIIAALEEKYKLFISEEMIAKIRTVEDLYNIVSEKLKE